MQRSSDYGKGDDPGAPCNWQPGRAPGDLPPPGMGPECCGTAAWARHPLAASTLWEEAKRQRRAGSEQGDGAQPNPKLEAQRQLMNISVCAKRLARAWSALDRVRLDSLAGRELSGGVASVSLELGRRVAPQRTGRSVAHTRYRYHQRRKHKRPERVGAERYKHDHAPGAEELVGPKCYAERGSVKRAAARRSQPEWLGKRRPREVRR